MKRWTTDPFGMLVSLDTKKAGEVLDFARARRFDILRVLAWGWAALLLMTFSLLLTVRLALHLPL